MAMYIACHCFHEDNGYKGMHPNNLGWAV